MVKTGSVTSREATRILPRAHKHQQNTGRGSKSEVRQKAEVQQLDEPLLAKANRLITTFIERTKLPKSANARFVANKLNMNSAGTLREGDFRFSRASVDDMGTEGEHLVLEFENSGVLYQRHYPTASFCYPS